MHSGCFLLLLLVLVSFAQSKGCTFAQSRVGPAPASHIRNMAVFLAEKGDASQSTQCFEEALERNGSDLQTHYQYLKALMLGDGSAARRQKAAKALEQRCSHWACSYLLSCNNMNLAKNSGSVRANALKTKLKRWKIALKQMNSSAVFAHNLPLESLVQAYVGFWMIETSIEEKDIASALPILRNAYRMRNHLHAPKSLKNHALWKTVSLLLRTPLPKIKETWNHHWTPCQFEDWVDVQWPALAAPVQDVQSYGTALTVPCAGSPCPFSQVLVTWGGFYMEPFGYGQDTQQLMVAAVENGLTFYPYCLRKSLVAAALEAEEERALDLARNLRISPTLWKNSLHVSILLDEPVLANVQALQQNSQTMVIRTLFETDRVPESWKEGLSLANEVWVASQFNVDTFTEAVPSLKGRVHVIPEAIPAQYLRLAQLPREQRRSQGNLNFGSGKRFHFLAVGGFYGRKDWKSLISAWVRAFREEDDCCLVLKAYSGEETPAALAEKLERIYMETEVTHAPPCVVSFSSYLAAGDMPQAYAAADALVSATHGEGWGRPLMEAMSLGLPVIATNWSAHTAFVRDDTGYPVKYTLAPVDAANVQEYPRFEGHVWATIDNQDLQAQMRHVYEELMSGSEVLKAKVQNGQDFIRRNYARSVVGQQIRSRLQALANENY